MKINIINYMRFCIIFLNTVASSIYSAKSALIGHTFILSLIAAFIELFIGLDPVIGGIFGIIKIIKFAKKIRTSKNIEAEVDGQFNKVKLYKINLIV